VEGGGGANPGDERVSRRDLALMALLAALPVVAHAPAWTQDRLLGPGDGAALHFPMRVAVWRAYEAREIPSWNPGIFSGTPLLASYRPGAFQPLMMALTSLPEFTAFQVLVLSSLSLASALLYVYLRRLGASRPGAFVSGLLFGLGPLLVGGLGDTATVAAAPMLVLVLLALERHGVRPGPGTTATLAVAMALVLYAGSPEVSGLAMLLVLGRVLFFRDRGGSHPGRARAEALFAVVCGLFLAAPQLVPTALAFRDAGPGTIGLAEPALALPGLAGLLVRYVSHTPAPALTLAALALFARGHVRSWTLVVVVALPLALASPGIAGRTAAVALDLALAVVAGLVISEHATVRSDMRGRRLRAYVLVGALASATGLSIATTLTGPLPQLLAGAVGVLAVALILFLAFGGSRSFVKAHVFLLPLTVSLLLQPYGRLAWSGAPSKRDLYVGTPTHQALDRLMLSRSEERVLSLVQDWPYESELDLGYAGLGSIMGRRSANGYDPLASARRRSAFDGMSEGGTLAPVFFHTDPGRLELLGIRFVQVRSKDLTTVADANGLGEALDVIVEPARPRYFPVPITATTEVRIESSLSDAVLVPQDAPVAVVTLRLASGRSVTVLVRAGADTAEWAFDRSDVTGLMRHRKAKVLETFEAKGAPFPGRRYLGVLRLSGRFLVDGIGIESLPRTGRLSLFRMGLFDAGSGHAVGVSPTSAYVSDAVRFKEAAATPLVRLLELRATLGRARVVDGLRRLPGDEAVLTALRSPLVLGIDPRREALASEEEARGFVMPEGARTSRAVVARSSPSQIELLAEGPGLLVVTEGWDAGWKATVDESPVRILRVNATHMGLGLSAGPHRIALVHRAVGLRGGLALAALGALALTGYALRQRSALTLSKSAG
jgi:hypothetical protein